MVDREEGIEKVRGAFPIPRLTFNSVPRPTGSGSVKNTQKFKSPRDWAEGTAQRRLSTLVVPSNLFRVG